jgi:hypothetical protein
VILVWAAFAGIGVFTVTDGRDIALIAAVAAGVAVVATARFWHEQSRDRLKASRLIGWSLVVVAAMPGVVGAFVFVIQAGSPQNLARPSVTGRAEVGSALTADPGRWSSPGGRLSFDYQWQACDGSNCTDINGASHRRYVPARRDLHRRIRFSASASASDGGINVFSSDWIRSGETAAVVP